MSKYVRTVVAAGGLLLFIVSFISLQRLPSVPVGGKAAPDQAAVSDAFGVVVIDAGHGGNDSGKIGDGVAEKDLTLDVARRTERILASQQVKTLLTRSDDQYVSLAARADIANRCESAVFVSIHFDDAQPAATGVETYYAAQQITEVPVLAAWLPFLQSARSAPAANVKSQSLAAFVQEAIVGRTHVANRGTRAEQFYVVANVRHPAVLVEGGFLSNREDRARITLEEYREQLATAIAEGVMRFREQLRATDPGRPPA